MAGLDPLGRRNILDTIDHLRATLGCAVVMVSHSMDDMADRAERVAVLSAGTLLRVGSTAEIFGMQNSCWKTDWMCLKFPALRLRCVHAA